MINGLANLNVVTGHEMSHANDARKGIKDKTIDTIYNSPKSEIKAIRTGNRIRGDFNKIRFRGQRYKLRSVSNYSEQGTGSWNNYLNDQPRH